MSVTCGFYNSLNHDRRYNAVQISSIFDGIISDGVYMSIGEHMCVKPDSGMMITVGVGRAWFNHSWTYNDSVLPIEVPMSEVILNRIDAVILEVNAEESIRDNSIKILKGTPATNPSRPALLNTSTVHQYPLAYIYVGTEVTEIRKADITNMVGTSVTPFVTGIIETINIDSLVAQWGDQWQKFYEKQVTDIEAANAYWKEQWSNWFDSETSKNVSEMASWKAERQMAFESWFSGLKDVVSSLENGEILLEVRDLLKDMYKMATETDIDHIISGTYIDEDNEGSLFETGTNRDIDDIINGDYADTDDDSGGSMEAGTSQDMTNIVENAFKEE